MNQCVCILYLFILVGFFASFSLLSWLVPFLRTRLLDKPNSRSSHNRPVPTGGGVVFVFLSVLSSAIYFFAQLAFLPAFSDGLLSLVLLPLLSIQRS